MPQAKQKKDSVAKMKRTFLRMSSPQGFDGNEKKRKATIVSANMAPLLGRAGAAYDVMVSLLDSVLPVTLTEEQRIDHYKRIEDLLTKAVNAATEAQRDAEADKFKLDLDPFSSYMRILRNITGALLQLVSGQARYLTMDKSVFYSNSVAMINTQSIADELKLYHMYREMIRNNAVALNRLRETIRIKLPQAEIDRLDTAASQYAEYLIKSLSAGEK